MSPATEVIDIDALLMDTWLLVVQIRQGAPVENAERLWAHCLAQVEHCRQQMTDAGLSQRSVELIGYAQCALLDETVLGSALATAHAGWASQPLQAHFFQRHEGGTQVYEDMRAVLAESAADPAVLVCYQRLLRLGFCGCYPDATAPEREQLLARLDQRVPPLAVSLGCAVITPRGWSQWSGWSSPLTHGLIALLVLTGLWWTLHSSLARTVATLVLVEG